MRIICDMDEVIVDMMNPLLKRYNEKHSSDITIEDITQWELPGDMKVIFRDIGFFYNLKPLAGAMVGIKRLMEWGHDVVIASNHSGETHIASQKVGWVGWYFPELSNNLMMGHRKDLLQGDVIIDDNPDYLISSPCPIKICMDRPWNRMKNIVKISYTDWNSGNPDIRINPGHRLYRVHNWQQILALFEGGAFKVW